MQQKTVSDLKPGDTIIIDVPCRVTVIDVVAVEGTVFRPNRLINYEEVEPVQYAGFHAAGSLTMVNCE